MRLDHIVLTVASVHRTRAFYALLGIGSVEFKPGRWALLLEGQKINLHEKGREFEPKALRPTPGSADICLVTQKPLSALVQELSENDIPVVEGPAERTGATGRLASIYVRDPDGNLVELSNLLTE